MLDVEHAFPAISLNTVVDAIVDDTYLYEQVFFLFIIVMQIERARDGNNTHN